MTEIHNKCAIGSGVNLFPVTIYIPLIDEALEF